jgi:hypothetical protein
MEQLKAKYFQLSSMYRVQINLPAACAGFTLALTLALCISTGASLYGNDHHVLGAATFRD